MKKLLLSIGLCLSMGGVLAAELTVSAAASLTNAFKDIGAAFEARYPETKVLFNFAGSNQLVAQIAKGAPVDVLATADQESMDLAVGQNLITMQSRRNFVQNTLVLIVPSSSSLQPKTLKDLSLASYKKIAVGIPASVPVGRYTQSVLEREKLWSSLEPKFVYANHVRQVLDYVARGEVDAGFVYATDAKLMPEKITEVLTLKVDKPISYPVALVKDSKQTESAQKFIQFLSSKEAVAILNKYGFKSI